MRIRVGIALAISLVGGAIAAGSAQASVTGPYWDTCTAKAPIKPFQDSRCKELGPPDAFGLTHVKGGQGLSFTAIPTATYELANGIQTLACTKQKVKEGATLNGSEEGNGGSSTETIEFTGCTVQGNGTPCEPTGGSITTAPLSDTLDFANKVSTKGEKILDMLRPVTGAVFAKIKFTGAGCTLVETAVEGSVAGNPLTESGKPITVEENEELGETGGIEFPATPIKVDFVEKGKAREEVKVALKAFGKAITKFIGKSSIKATSGTEAVSWGVITF